MQATVLIPLFFILLMLNACSMAPPVEDDLQNDALAKVELKMALIALEQQQILAAKARLLWALQLAPNDPEINVAWGHYLAITGNTAAASSAYQKALNEAPNSAEIQDDYAVFLYREGRYQQALAYFLKAARQQSYLYSAIAYQNASFAAEKLGESNLAVHYQSKAQQELPALK